MGANDVGAVLLVLSYAPTLADMVAPVLAHPAMRKRYEQQVWNAGWRRGLRVLPITLGIVLLANIFMFELDLVWGVVSTVVLACLFAVVLWSQIDHTIKRRLPLLLEQQARHDLARRGDQRRIVAGPGGLTLVDAAATEPFGWHQVHLTETDRHVIVTAGVTSWAIPRTVGQPLRDLVQFARGHGAG